MQCCFRACSGGSGATAASAHARASAVFKFEGCPTSPRFLRARSRRNVVSMNESMAKPDPSSPLLSALNGTSVASSNQVNSSRLPAQVYFHEASRASILRQGLWCERGAWRHLASPRPSRGGTAAPHAGAPHRRAWTPRRGAGTGCAAPPAHAPGAGSQPQVVDKRTVLGNPTAPTYMRGKRSAVLDGFS